MPTLDRVLHNANDKCRRRHTNRCRFRRRNLCLFVAISAVLLSLAMLLWHGVSTVISDKHSPISYTPPHNSNPLLATYERVMSSPDILNHARGNEIVALLLHEDGKLLCRKSHMNQMKLNVPFNRAVSFVQMLQTGLANDIHSDHGKIFVESERNSERRSKGKSLPILVYADDSNGCRNRERIDRVGFPRFTHSIPAFKYKYKHNSVVKHLNENRTEEEEEEWCAAIDMVGYERWTKFRYNVASSNETRMIKLLEGVESWDHTFQHNHDRYPWESKINKAVWRGTTTGSVPTGNCSDLPRVQLVRKSMTQPDLFDVGFTGFIQTCQGMERDPSEQQWTQSAKRDVLSMDKQMKYRAMLDIDGNGWSSRFSSLLCSNSVVIKIDPDYVEYFYKDVLPNKHYIPASLDNITDVVAYVMDTMNDNEMKEIVKEANLWCQRSNTKNQLGRDMVSQLHKYEMAIYNKCKGGCDWADEWEHVQRRLWSNIGTDLVECNVKEEKGSPSNRFSIAFYLSSVIVFTATVMAVNME